MNDIHMKSRRHSTSSKSATHEFPIKIGLVRLADAAPFILAGELGYYEEAGLRVSLSWELGWASIKHKIAYGQLDAAHALAPLPLSLSLGLNIARTAAVALLVTSRLGNAITLSSSFRERGVSNTDEFRQEVRSSRGKRRYVFGVVSLESSHHILLRTWLRQTGIDPDKDVRIVVVPPGQAIRNLRARTLDGYCVGEPWNSLAVREQQGWCPALSHEIAPAHPEKVLLARMDRVEESPERFRALVEALQKASEYCASPDNAALIARKMRKATILGTAAQGMERILRGEFDRGDGTGEARLPIIRFCQKNDSSVSRSDMSWIAEGMQDCGLIPDNNKDFANRLAAAYLAKI